MAKPVWAAGLRTGVSPSFLIGKEAKIHTASGLDHAGPLREPDGSFVTNFEFCLSTTVSGFVQERAPRILWSST